MLQNIHWPTVIATIVIFFLLSLVLGALRKR